MNKKVLLWAGVILLGIGLVSLGVFIARALSAHQNPLPAEVKKNITFSPLVIGNSEKLRATNYSLTTVEDGTMLLTYTITTEGHTVDVSQYPQPSQFTDVPDFKTKFLEDVIQQTASVSSAGGTIYLGQMAKQQNKQMAVMLERGLVLFLLPNETLNETEWRSIGDSFFLVSPQR